MSRFVIVCSAPLADGFRLAGPETVEARHGAEASAALRRVASERDVGLVLVTADLWASVDESLRRTLERLPRPIVLSIPAGVVTDFTTRRQLIGEMLQHAIGYRIELSGGTWR